MLFYSLKQLKLFIKQSKQSNKNRSGNQSFYLGKIIISERVQLSYQTKIQTTTNHMKYINVNQVLEVDNCRQSLAKWLKHFKQNTKNAGSSQGESQSGIERKANLQKQLVSNQDKQIQAELDRYLKTVKPVIDNFTSLTQNLDEKEYGFYSDLLSESQIIFLKQLFQPLRKFTILPKEDFISRNNIEILGQEQVLKMVKTSEPIYKMDLKNPPNNPQFKYWGHTVRIEKFTIQGVVQIGKKLGKQGLGMPTANTRISSELNKNLQSYPNGIYITTVTFKNKPSQIYIGASSLGTNPHYENSYSERILETYIINDFKEETFYGQILLTEFHELIRPEFKFKDFSSFLHGMRNDIEVAKQWVKKASFQKQLFCS